MEGTGAALVLGDPAFHIKTERLKAAGEEAAAIAATLGHHNVLALTGRNASKQRVLEWTKQAIEAGTHQAVMHLATHAHLGSDKFREGALEFADPKVKIWPPPEVGSNELRTLQSSTPSADQVTEVSEAVPSSESASRNQPQELPEPAFSCSRGNYGPTRGKIDPRHLTAEEIVKDYEWRMLLAVLSACETARGEVKSEGTLNLARALLISGVPSTIVSQWKVDDKSAPVLMAGLYREMMAGLDVASALRSAMNDMIDKGFQVHQWAPFVVMGLGTVTLPDRFLPSCP